MSFLLPCKIKNELIIIHETPLNKYQNQSSLFIQFNGRENINYAHPKKLKNILFQRIHCIISFASIITVTNVPPKINKTFTSFNLHILSIAYHTSINLQSISAIVVLWKCWNTAVSCLQPKQGKVNTWVNTALFLAFFVANSWHLYFNISTRCMACKRLIVENAAQLSFKRI